MSGLLRPHLITLRVDADTQRQLAQAAGVLNLTVEAYAMRLFEAAFFARFGASLDGKMLAAVKAAGLMDNADTPKERSGTARKAPSTFEEPRAVEPVVVAAAPVEVQPAAPPDAAGPNDPAAPCSDDRAVMSPRLIKTVRGYRSAGNSFAEIARLTGLDADQCKAACRGMR